MKNEVAEHGTSPVLSNDRDPFSWGGYTYPTYAGVLEDPAGQGAAAGSPPAPPAGSPPASATTGSLDWATAPKQFREAYDKLKTETEPWTKLGKKPEEVTTGLQQADRYGKLHGDFIGVAEKLGYSQEEFEDAMEKNPGATVRFLLKKAAEQGAGRQPAARRDPNAPPEDRLKELVNEAVAPLNEFHNQQLVQAAEVRFEQEFDRLNAEAYPKGLPEEMNLFLENVVSTLMGNDDRAMLALKKEGKVASIAKYYQEGRAMVEKAFTAWSAHNTKSEGGPGGKPPGGNDKPGGFDKSLKIGDLVEDISKLNPKYA